MKEHPIDVAVRNLFEARILLEKLITSSETFDYIAAKEALRELQIKSKKLAGVQAGLQGRHKSSPKLRLLKFEESPQLELELAN
jgi:hypothetical protein